MPDKMDIFRKIREERGGVAKIHSSFEAFPEGVSAHFYFYEQIILANNLPLSRAEREFLAVKTSEANECPYCIGHHRAAYENFTSSPINPVRENALRTLAETLSKTMWKANPQKKNFLDAGFTEAEWQHAVMVVAYFNFANRCAHAMGLELEENFQTTCR